MIDNYLLEELVTFEKYGTLAATAQHLSVTQPTVTRGMQKIEDELNLKIFDRQPNRITLTKTGVFAAQEAQKVLNRNQSFIDDVHKYDYNHRNIHIGSIAPGPLIVLHSFNLSKNIKIENSFVERKDVSQKLREHDFSLIVTNQEIQTDDLESIFIGTEKLSVNLDKFTYLANKSSVTFKELEKTSFIVLTDIGIWKDVIQSEIPKAKFLYQDQVDAFTEITNYSNFPYFSTNLSKLDSNHKINDNDDRVRIPISDESAKIDFYATYLKGSKSLVNPIIKKITNSWV